MIKNTWKITRWCAGTTSEGPTTSLTIDCRPAPDSVNWKSFTPLLHIKFTDRYTEAEYEEIAKIIVDRLNAWEVEKEMS